jgi:glycosyltransferase involved in cell wall biosynthesis
VPLANIHQTDASDMCELVSIIIPAFNAGKYLDESVESVLSQSHTNLECIIVDDGSTDNTHTVAARLTKKDPRVRYKFKTNGGAASARNTGVRYAKGEWVFLLDADDWMHEDTIKIQLQHAINSGNRKKTVIYSDFEVVWQDSKGNILKTYRNMLQQMTKPQLLKRIMSYVDGPTMPLSPINTLLSKDIFSSNSYDESFGAWEEINFFIDILLMTDSSFIYAPTVASVYRIHGSNSTKNKQRMFENYVKFLMTTNEKDRSLLRYCVTIGPLIKKSVLEKNRNNFNQLVKLVKKTDVPVYLKKGGLNLNSPILWKFLYILRSLIPARSVFSYYKK